MGYSTEQEEFWAGDFGTEYIERNKSNLEQAARIASFSKILKCTSKINSIVELGANIGLNLQAIKLLLPEAKLNAVEINKDAVQHLNRIADLNVIHESILELNTKEKYDLSLIKGVLIHINPDSLPIAYEKLYQSSNKYICIAEYFNPSPVEISYRGHENKLFKRDFAGEILAAYPDLELIDYGFLYSKDNNFQFDDITWFLLEKK
ncbi:MAG: pseudaminic acid biosynthesis-associated methylase [Oleispira sp.]